MIFASQSASRDHNRQLSTQIGDTTRGSLAKVCRPPWMDTWKFIFLDIFVALSLAAEGLLADTLADSSRFRARSSHDLDLEPGHLKATR